MREPVRNRLLSKLPSVSYQLLQPHLEEVSLSENQVLYDLGDTVDHVYFPHNVVTSLSIEIDAGRSVEIAMEGNEGATGLAILLGGLNRSALCTVRHAGIAMRLPVDVLTQSINLHEDFAVLLRRYIHALLIQIAQSGLCNRLHPFDARLARWLRMTHDRTGKLELKATQISIAKLLGVRRSTVTEAAKRLLKQNIIDYRRGHIEIIDADRLANAACSCYTVMQDRYNSFLD